MFFGSMFATCLGAALEPLFFFEKSLENKEIMAPAWIPKSLKNITKFNPNSGFKKNWFWASLMLYCEGGGVGFFLVIL